MGAIDASIVNVALPHLRGARRRHRRGDHLGHHRLRDRERAGDAADRLPRPALRPEARLHGVPRAVRRRLGAVRPRAHRCRRWSPSASLQGLGAGALQPTEQAILRQTFPPEEQGMAMALFGMAVMIGPAVGPTLGGYIVDNYSWPWIFYINLPVGVLGLFMVHALRPRAGGHPRGQPRPRPRSSARTWTGPASRCWRSALATLQYVLEEGSRNDWFESRAHRRCCALVARVRAGGVRHPRADRAGAGRQPAPVQGPVFLSGTLDRRGDVRDADVDHVPAAGVHAGAARLHRDAVGPRADAAHARDDGRRCPIVGRLYNQRPAAHRWSAFGVHPVRRSAPA